MFSDLFTNIEWVSFFIGWYLALFIAFVPVVLIKHAVGMFNLKQTIALIVGLPLYPFIIVFFADKFTKEGK